VLVADKELVPNRIVATFNLLYLPEIAHSRVTGIWSRQATIGVATALMAQIGPESTRHFLVMSASSPRRAWRPSKPPAGTAS
jgi:hypothetical protein